MVKLKGTITIPADKSVSHRAIIFGALSKSEFEIKNLSLGQDCLNTLKIFSKLGMKYEFLSKNHLKVDSTELFNNLKDDFVFDCGNSGTTTRLLIGLFSSVENLKCTLVGDDSLSKRPMKRVIEPLSQMGAEIEHNDYKLPIKIKGKKLKGIEYFSPVASAQVKSCLILAGLNADGLTKIYENTLSRNHSEIMLEYLNCPIGKGKDEKGYFVEVKKNSLTSKDIEVVGDISSAAFFMVAAAIVPTSRVLIKNVGLNPTRTGIIDIFKQAEIDFKILNERKISNELTGDVEVNYTKNIKPFEIKGDIIPRLIDEIPILAILASQANGKSIVKDAKDLRNKESDRISTIVEAFKKLDIEIVENEDGFIIEGKKAINKDVFLKTHLDHRLAMSYYVLSLINKGKTEIEDMSCINTSFPEFLDMMGILKD